MRQADAVRDRAHLHRHDVAVDGAMPDRFARRPRRDQIVRIAGQSIGADETHRDAIGLARHIEGDFVAIEPHRAAAFALHQPAGQLSGNLPLALAKHMVDRGSHGRQPPRDLAFRRMGGKALRKFLRDEAGGKLALAPARMAHQRRQERNVVPDPVDVKRIQRGRLRLDRSRPRRRMRDELGDHRIVMDRDFAAFLHAGIVADGDTVLARFGRRAVLHQPANGRQEVAERVLGIDARFHRPSRQRDVFLRDRKLLAGGNPDHLLDEVDAGDELSDGMFDLQTGIHLQEVEALVLAGDEFDRAGGIVVHGLRQRHRLLAHPAAGGLVEQRRRRLLDDLLVAALDRTFALAEIDHVAMLVAEHLDFDVAGIDDEFLDEDAIVAE